MRRPLGLLGILIGSILPPLAVGASPLPSCDGCREPDRGLGPYCPELFTMAMPIANWTPTVDPRGPGEPATCLPTGESGGGRSLVDAAKPPGYDPYSAWHPLQACLLVSRQGAVEAVRLGAVVAEPSRSAALADAMRAWRFAPAASGTSTWVRIRLIARYDGATPPDAPL
ncbi:MAG TPA: hypothetical protein VEZ20_16565 [Allosphingosinicella sp.]|nr:hypothetical protein [Allosphingosinicella sp.]